MFKPPALQNAPSAKDGRKLTTTLLSGYSSNRPQGPSRTMQQLHASLSPPGTAAISS
jgi:hypothetical protein